MSIRIFDLPLFFEAPGDGAGGDAGEGGGGAASAVMDPPAPAAAGEGEGTGGESPPAPDPVADAALAAVRLQLAEAAKDAGVEGEFDSYDQLRTAVREKTRIDTRTQNDAKVQAKHGEVAKSIRDGLTAHEIKAQTAEGEEVTVKLTEADITRLTSGLDDLSTTARNEYEAEVFLELATIAGDILDTADARKAFEDAKPGEKGIADWLNTLIETTALNTKAVKAMSLEDAIKASPVLKLAHEKAVADAKAEGFTQGKSAPEGTPSQRGAGESAGKLTAEQFKSMTKAEQAEAWRVRPDEVRAL